MEGLDIDGLRILESVKDRDRPRDLQIVSSRFPTALTERTAEW